jgi:hypothetical protein
MKKWHVLLYLKAESEPNLDKQHVVQRKDMFLPHLKDEPEPNSLRKPISHISHKLKDVPEPNSLWKPIGHISHKLKDEPEPNSLWKPISHISHKPITVTYS